VTLFVGTYVWSLAFRRDEMLLTTDKDFIRAASHCTLRVWRQPR
jgi:predicted nuclease of predicted toxin-antitoxin system